MKRLTRLLALTATATFAAFSTTAQEHDFSSVSINGLDTYKIYTREQIIDNLQLPCIPHDYGHGTGLRRFLPE